MLLEAFPGKKRRGISLTPLIDVVFILLLFFMLSSDFMHWRQISLSSANETESKPDSVELIRIESDSGELSHDGKRFALQDLAGLTALVAAEPDAVYAVEAVAGVKTQTLVSVLDQLHKAGADKVSMTGVLP
ncbi:ExbD/TolR family protein [Pseudomonas neustonica]|uniref:ExbD/TolR family protein n=1 Tax=Pseudomonas neustonica TaxID=2487346 RepID=UPI003C9E06EF|tara:strand:+ start:378 stop:773 length:396 start_codon:yes stop_codon:yes gene_type:complete